jgi:phosphoribosylamine-glycine ligase
MEGSKTFSKDFMKRHGIPTAKYENFGDYEAASKYLESIQHNVVIKASGLAAGKGVHHSPDQKGSSSGTSANDGRPPVWRSG